MTVTSEHYPTTWGSLDLDLVHTLVHSLGIGTVCPP